MPQTLALHSYFRCPFYDFFNPPESCRTIFITTQNYVWTKCNTKNDIQFQKLRTKLSNVVAFRYIKAKKSTKNLCLPTTELYFTNVSKFCP
jgi:hypothetical protein